MNRLILIAIFYILSSHFLHAQGPQWIVYNTGNSGLPGNTVYSIAFEGNVKWFGTNRGLARLENNQWTVYDTSNSEIPDQIIRVVRVNESGVKLIGTNTNGIAIFDDINWTIYDTSNSPLPYNWVYGADFDTSGNMWIATILGVAKTNGVSWEIFNSSNVDSLSNPIEIIFDPVTNKKWVGAQTRGLFIYDDNVWTRYTTFNSGLSSNQVRAVSFDKQNNVWIGTYAGGLDKFNETGNIWTHSLSAFIECIAIDSTGYKWLGSGDGVYKFDDSVLAIFNPGNSPMPSYNVNDINIEINQNIWIGTDGGVAVYNENGIVGINTLVEELPKDFELYQNYPNPFNPSTTISFEIKKKSEVKLSIYDINGKLVEVLLNRKADVGKHQAIFSAGKLPSGIYFYSLFTDGILINSKKMLLIK